MDELTNKVQSSIDEAVNAGDKNALLEQMKTVDNAKIDTYNKAMLNDAPFLGLLFKFILYLLKFHNFFPIFLMVFNKQSFIGIKTR